jgi:predicted small integral membrane protein
MYRDSSLARRWIAQSVPSAAVFVSATAQLFSLAQGVRIDRPPPGTLRRGIIGLDSPRAPALLLSLTVAVVLLLLGVAIVRRLQKR